MKRILPAGQFETYAYDTGGNLQNRTDFNGKTTTFNYDVMRRLLSKVPDASLNQPTISFTYNNIGQRATMSDASGTTMPALRNMPYIAPQDPNQVHIKLEKGAITYGLRRNTVGEFNSRIKTFRKIGERGNVFPL